MTVRPAETTYVMIFVVALLVWFAVSIPASLILGRVIAGRTDDNPAPAPPRRIRTSGRILVGR